MRRGIRDADQKEFVACGVMSWRALYVTALNCPPTFEWGEEARAPKRISPPVISGCRCLDSAEGDKEEPIHYLLITKGEPHRRQIGRIVERINSMGTMRLIALRDYSIIRDASTQIQLRGQELDTMMRSGVRRARYEGIRAYESKGKSAREEMDPGPRRMQEIKELADWGRE